MSEQAARIDGPSMLEWLRGRRSVRVFDGAPVELAVLERILEAATTAPSSTNRQPWRFAVVTAAALRARIVLAVKQRSDALKAIIQRSHHAADFADYSDFFYEPLTTAAAIVVPQYREHPDLIANFLVSAGEDPARFQTAQAMQAELCATSAAVMALLLQSRAEGLGACWMAGPMVARADIEELCEIRAPWQMVGAVALGHLAGAPPSAPGRKPLDRVVRWFHDEEQRNA